jgi:hypothetical protein
VNPLEILDVKAFHPADVPRPLALGQDDMIDAALARNVVFE